MTLEGIAVFLCTRGAGKRSLWWTMKVSGVIGFFIGASQTAVYSWEYWAPNDNIAWGFGVKFAAEGVMFVAYLLLLLLPIDTFYRRPAAIYYAAFWCMFRPIYVAILVTVYLKVDPGYCLYLAFTLLVYGFLIPAVVIATLRKDNAYWQGVVEKGLYLSISNYGSMSRSASEADIRRPLLDTHFDAVTAGAVAAEMDVVDDFCETISYSHIELRQENLTTTSVLGAGGTSRVFPGKYLGEPVALKMVFCMQLTPESVENFFRESALLSRLRHPSIVHMHGVCVLPPALCMVMELCQGSLYELLRLPEYRQLDWGERLSTAIDCARGVACMHEQVPPILHKDLKSANFLIGKQQIPTWRVQDVQQWLATVRLRCFQRDFRRGGVNGAKLLQLDRSSLAKLVGAGAEGVRKGAFERLVSELAACVDSVEQSPTRVIKLTDLELSDEDDAKARDGAQVEAPQTINWTAPEVLRDSKSFETPADVYSLTMVLWEILTAQVPFDEPGLGPEQGRDQILNDGKRPPIPEGTPVEYAQLLMRGWADDPADRPSAGDLRDALILMRRRWNANRTLQLGKFVDGGAQVKLDDASFKETRFAAADEGREGPAAAAAFSMGSLMDLNVPLLEPRSPPSPWSPSRGGHRRTRSDGEALLSPATAARMAYGAAGTDELAPSYC